MHLEDHGGLSFPSDLFGSMEWNGVGVSLHKWIYEICGKFCTTNRDEPILCRTHFAYQGRRDLLMFLSFRQNSAKLDSPVVAYIVLHSMV